MQRSKAALDKDVKERDVEHVAPISVIVGLLMSSKPPNEGEVRNILNKYYRIMLVTKDEQRNLRSLGRASKMPSDWDGKDIWARYRIAGIEFDQ